MKTINLKVVIALILGSVTMAFTTPKTLDRDGKLPVTKERKNIFNYISREQIEIENRAVIEKMSPEARKKMAESFAKFQAKNKGNLCLYIFNECTANLNNYCKLNLMDKNNITHLNYSIPTNNSKLVGLQQFMDVTFIICILIARQGLFFG